MRFFTPLLCGLIAAVCCFTFPPAAAFGKTVDMPAQWVSTPVKVDGVQADWPERSILFFADQEYFIGTCNDSTDLYVILRFRNPDWARRIRHGGLTIYLDPKGKKGKDFKLQFTGGPSMKEIMAISGRNQGGDGGQMPAERRERMRDRDEHAENAFLCYQRQYMTEKAIPMDGSEGPAVAAAVDNGFFVYEFRIPLAASTLKSFGLGVQPGRKIGLGLIWGDADTKKMHGRMRGGDGGGFPGGGGGGRPPGDGGGMSRGGPGEGPRGGMSMGGTESKKQEIWVTVQLASPDLGTGAAGK
jgi:hypothetical protein